MSDTIRKKHHILVVDDELISQIIYTNILSKYDFIVTCANNGLEAITKPLELFSVILMDINMPKMDGITATKEIRKKLNQDQLPIIGITADPSLQTKKKCITAGMNYVAIKPIHTKTLQQILKKFNIC